MIDVLVAGGGPAGLATALYAARSGMSVVVMEPRSAPIDKACGEGLMPGAWRAVHDLVGDVEGLPLRGIRYLDATGRTASATFRSGPGRGVRRTTLQRALHQEVLRAGVTVLAGRVSDVRQDQTSVTAGPHRARYLIAADGLHSALRTELGLACPASGPVRYGLRRHLEVAPWTDHVEVHWAAHAEAYVTPVAAHQVGVAVLTSRKGSFDEHLAAFPTLRKRLMGAAPGPVRGAGPLRQNTSARRVGRVLLVGDAAGYVDALTGEGLAVSLASAQAAINALAVDRPQDYEATWRRLSRRYRWITGALVHATAHQALRRALVPAASRLPRVLDAVVHQLAR